MSVVRIHPGEPKYKGKRMEQDKWFIYFVDDPCDDISGENLHLWIKLKEREG